MPATLSEEQLIPAEATCSEKWILLKLFQTRSIKATAKECNRTLSRVRQVVRKYKIDVVNL